MIGIVGAILMIMGVFVGIDGTLQRKTYDQIWRQDYIDGLKTDRERIIAGGLTASSSHNMQPWKVRFVDDSGIILMADMDKTLPVVDGDHRQLLMGQGAFIQAANRAAAQWGYTLDVEYHPIDWTINQPVIATLHMVPSDAVEAEGVAGATMMADDDGKADLITSVDRVMAEYPNLQARVIDQPAAMADMQHLLRQGTLVESGHEAAMTELLDIFRFTERDKNAHHYGLSLSMPKGIMPLMGPIVKASAGNWEAFGQSGITAFEKRLDQGVAYIVMMCPDPEALDYIQAGQALQQLGYQLSGYSIRPAVQLLQDVDGMEKWKQRFDEQFAPVGEALLIISVQPAQEKVGYPSVRHTVDEILVD